MLKTGERNQALTNLTRHIIQPKGSLMTGKHVPYPVDGPAAGAIAQLDAGDVIAFIGEILIDAILKALVGGQSPSWRITRLTRRIERLQRKLAALVDEVDERGDLQEDRPSKDTVGVPVTAEKNKDAISAEERKLRAMRIV